jgi:hypothetical protein
MSKNIVLTFCEHIYFHVYPIVRPNKLNTKIIFVLLLNVVDFILNDFVYNNANICA